MDILDLIRQRATAAGVDPNVAITIARIESGLDPSSNRNASTRYKGLYQLGPDEWAKYGKGDLYDPGANTDAFLNLYKSNSAALAQKLGRDPTPGEAYFAHQQGVAGAHALLSNPDMNAVDAIAPFYKNRATAVAAIKGNGGDPNGTAGDFANYWVKRFDNMNGTMPQPAQAQSTSAATDNSAAQAAQTGLLSPDAKKAASMQFAMGLLSAGQPQAPVPQINTQAHRPQLQGFTNPFAGLLG